MRWWSFGLFAVLAVTDYFDGYLARALKQSSALGALMDPIADKVSGRRADRGASRAR